LAHTPENIDVLLLEGTVLDRGLKGEGVKEFKSEAEIEDELEFSFLIGFAGE
jgi:ribonuclease J